MNATKTAQLAIASATLALLGLPTAPTALVDTLIDLPVVGTVATIRTLPVGSISVAGNQSGTLSISVKTHWVDVRATVDSPNIVQAGLYHETSQWKLQIAQAAAGPHTAQCRIKGIAGGDVLASGPAVDVSDGAWHEIDCVKSPDRGGMTAVQVLVDGLAGAVFYVPRIGDVRPTRAPTLGGRTTTADSDSLDGLVDGLSVTTS